MKNYQILLTSLLSFGVAYSVLMGYAQKFVPFAGELNEIAVFILSSTMGTMCLFGLNYKGLYRWLVSE